MSGKKNKGEKKAPHGTTFSKPPTPAAVSLPLYADLTLGCYGNDQP